MTGESQGVFALGRVDPGHVMGLSTGASRATFAAAAVGVTDVLAGRRPVALADPEWTPDGSRYRLAEGVKP